jgi:CRP-like cAMP-binding protein
MARHIETLQGIKLFSSLSRSAVKELDDQCVWRRAAAKQWIIDYQESGVDVFFVVSGLARVLIYAKSGREVILSDLGTGGFFGELAAIDGKPRSAGVLAVTDTVIASMPGRVFMSTLRENPDVAVEALKLLASRIRILDNRVLEYSTLNVKQRIYAELLRLSRPDLKESNQGVITPPPTHTDIAARVSTHREAVAREMKSLEREGVLLRRRGAVAITDVSNLMLRLDKQK